MAGMSIRDNGNASMTVKFAIFKNLSADGKKADALFAVQTGRTSKKVETEGLDEEALAAAYSAAAKEIFFSLAADAAELAGVALRTDEQRAAAKMFEGSLTWKVGDVTVVASPDNGNPNRTEATLMITPPSYPMPEKKVKKEANTVAAVIDW